MPQRGAAEDVPAVRPVNRSDAMLKDANFLLELGTEEIPAGYLPPAIEAVRKTFTESLDAGRIGYGSHRGVRHATAYRGHGSGIGCRPAGGGGGAEGAVRKGRL